ncbi:MAG: OB-fold nucleic acid binding domain-containing protein, partial [Hungatella hathewayi]
MKNQESVLTLKGIGERTGKLFAKLGIETVDDLLKYYPRAYHSYAPPTAIGELKPDMTGTVEGYLQKDVSVKRFKNKQIITASLQDMTGKLQLVWFNMPFLRTTLKMGTYHIFCGRVVKKNNRLTMEQPEIFTKESYGALMESMQPVYGQTRGLNNKTITKAVSQALENRTMEREYLPADLRRKYELAEYN